MERDLYAVLGVRRDADFVILRKAYRRRALECHPDRHDGDRRRAEEFRQVVGAFDLLSDPLRRRDYDAAHAGPDARGPLRSAQFVQDEGAILDTFADDILEELIVGNAVPRNTSMATLMEDLERTQHFVLFRQAKNEFYAGRIDTSARTLQKYLGLGPSNILAHYFLARCDILRGNWRPAERSLATALRIGRSRVPPLRLLRIERELDAIRREHGGLLAAIRRLLVPSPPVIDDRSATEREREALSRAMSKLADRQSLPPP